MALPRIKRYRMKQYFTKRFFFILLATNQQLVLAKIEQPTVTPPIYAQADIEVHNKAYLGANTELLNNHSSYDKTLFARTIADAKLDIKGSQDTFTIPIQAHATLRLNTIWANSAETNKSSSQHIKIGRALTETYHEHAYTKPLFWLREGWIKLESSWKETFVQLGFFKKSIGLGLILGDAYQLDDTVNINPYEQAVDQFRPGILIHSQLTEKLSIEGYIGLNQINSTHFNSQAGMTNSQELKDNSAPYHRKSPHHDNNLQDYIVSFELPYTLHKDNSSTTKCTITPFMTYHKNNIETVEFLHDARSSICTIGTSFNLEKNKFKAQFDIGFNIGEQQVKAWDRNESQHHAHLVQTHVFAKYYASIADPSQPVDITSAASGDWNMSPVFAWPEEQDISLLYPAGYEYSDNNPNLFSNEYNPVVQDTPFNMNHNFLNSYSKYRKSYTNNIEGWMFAADISYEWNKNLTIGAIAGYASGDNNPNDGYEKPFLYRLDNSWDQVRKDINKTYKGFIGTQSLYMSKNVPSLFMLTARKMNKPLQGSSKITSPEFSNLVYGGVGLHIDKTYNHTKVHLNTNMLFFATSCQETFGYDPSLFELYSAYIITPTDTIYHNRFANHNKLLAKALGLELNLFTQIDIKDHFHINAQIGAFIPGAYYNDIKLYSDKQSGKHIPLKNQYELYRVDRAGAENLDIFSVRLLNNVCWYATIGFTLEFDSLFSTNYKK